MTRRYFEHLQADIDPDFPGSCGRCYQVRCKPGLVIGNGTTPVSTETFYYMPSVSTSVKDTQGRTWPGNDAEADKELVRITLPSHMGRMCSRPAEYLGVMQTVVRIARPSDLIRLLHGILLRILFRGPKGLMYMYTATAQPKSYLG